MKTILQRAAVIGALGVLTGGCAILQKTAEEPVAGASQETRVEVYSQHWDDVRVYAIGSGARVRLGMVGSMETRIFKLPSDVITGDGSVRLIANPIGAPFPHQTDHILLRPGDLVEWHIENPLSLSSYAVRAGGGR